MNVYESNDFPLRLSRQWVTTYNRYLYLILALRDTIRYQLRSGLIQDQITSTALALTEVNDQLQILGYSPLTSLPDREQSLWHATNRFLSNLPWICPPAGVPTASLAADIQTMVSAWNEFARFVGVIPHELFRDSPALDPMATRSENVRNQIVPRSHLGLFPVGDVESADSVIAVAD